MKLAPTILALLVLPAAKTAAAQDVHKCTVDGAVTYSQTPCPANAASASVLAVPPAPAPDPHAGAELARQKKQIATLEKARLKREDKADRELERNARAARANDAQRKKCAKLKMNKTAADEEGKTVVIQNEAKVRARAKRAADLYALECS